jgi:hypothetical protein
MTDQPYVRRMADELRLISLQDWIGTTVALLNILTESGLTHLPSAVHLGRWLRGNEPTLWWDYGVRIEFSRSGEKRQVHLSRRAVSVIDKFRRQ